MRVFIAENGDAIYSVARQIDGIEVVGTADSTNTILEKMTAVGGTDVLLVSIYTNDNSHLIPLLKDTKLALPNMKVALVTENINVSSPANQKALAYLEQYHVDIIKGTISEEKLRQYVGIPESVPQFDMNTTPEQNREPAKTAPTPSVSETPDVPPSSPTPRPTETLKRQRNNLFMISSPKAGSGKSFVSSNLAYLLAVYGRNKRGTDKKPTVMLVDGDLQTLSVGTLLGIEDDTYNLKEVLQRVSTIVDGQGNSKGTPAQRKTVQEFIAKSCLLVNDHIPNFYTMVSSTFSLAEREKVSPYHYYYLIQTLMNMFDIVLVDSNSASEHKTTGPTMQKARKIFMVVTADYEGIRVAQKTEQDLMALDVDKKTGYILNKCITKSQMHMSSEESMFNPDEYIDPQRIVARIPYVDQIVQYNRIYDQAPLVLDKGPETLLARIAFTQLASTIWPMDNYGMLAKEVQELQRKL